MKLVLFIIAFTISLVGALPGGQQLPREALAAVGTNQCPAGYHCQQQTSAGNPEITEKFEIDQFNFLAPLGHTGIGKILLAEHSRSRKLYAVKILSKGFISDCDEADNVYFEKRVYRIINREKHPFLERLYGCFQTDGHLYFATEYLAGGDLITHLQRRPFGLECSRLYAAEVCMGLDFLHKKGILHRNLKLDNVYLAADGHIKMSDFYFCKGHFRHGSKTATFCGTPSFIAPEMLLDKEYGWPVDWFHFGVLLYQMLLQQEPFRGENEDEILDATLAAETVYPPTMPENEVSIIKKLLVVEPNDRLGSGPTDAQEVMSHPFFKDIVWDDIYHKRVIPPFIPTIKDEKDLSNFDHACTSNLKNLHSSYSTLPTTAENEFRKFDFTADFA